MNKTKIYAVLSVLILYLFFIQKLYADSPATPDPGVENFAGLLINEVSFKNSEHDWIELFVVNGGSIKGLKLFDDNNFINIEETITVNAGDYIMIYFKADENLIGYDGELLVIQSTKTGLTGTTEQIALINSNDETMDFICWRNASPTSGEIQEFNELIEGQWIYGNIESCINSDQVSNTDSIARNTTEDTNSPEDWQISNIPNPGQQNFLEEEPVPESEELPEINLPTLVFEFEEETELEEISNEVNSNDEENENICTNDIIINEILPNPLGKDSNMEWIELKNLSDKNCTLSGWIIDDEDGGSKPYTLTSNEEIISHGFILLPSWKTKINLNNSDESVRLFYPDEKIADEISYDKSYEDQTFSRTENNEFEWTIKLTPLTENLFIEKEEFEEEEEDEIKSATKDQEKIIRNGDLSNSIFINEIFPNPDGTDKGNEWIELYNDSEETVNLGNWKIDTGENSKSKYIFQNKVIGPHEHLLIYDNELAFSLKNSNGEVRLLDFQNSIIDQISYEKAQESESFTKFTIINDETKEFKWEWTKNTTPGMQNPQKNKFEGEVLEFDELNSVLSLKIDSTEEELKINVLNDGASNFKQIFLEGTKIAAVTSADNILDEYEILEQPEENDQQENTHNYLLYILLGIIPLGIGGFYYLKKSGILVLSKA
ncbi:lamin tail domain-containing protein [Patescibacteria group bacterium]